MTIVQVSKSQYSNVAEFLVGGAERNSVFAVQSRGLEHFALANPERTSIWQALANNRTLAAIMLIQSAGRTGLVVHSPSTAYGVDFNALVELISHVSRQALARGLSMVQELTAPPPNNEIAVLTAAGFELLADLIYMRLDLRTAQAPQAAAGVSRLHWGQYGDKELGEVIWRSYSESKDCPRLYGVRRMEDIIAGHQASGVFCPGQWHLYYVDGAAAGCMLVNDAASGSTEAEVAYLGVAPPFRGRGLARLMLRNAAADLSDRGLTRLSLAVDAGNDFARHVYDSEGFRATHRRIAYAIFGCHASANPAV